MYSIWWLVPTSSQHVLDAGIGLGKEATLCIFSDQHQHKSREEKKRSLWRWNSYKKQHTILYYFILSFGPLASATACLLQPLCCLHSVKKRYVVVLFCRIGTIQNHSYELPLPSPLDIFKDDPQQKNVTKGERICHRQKDDLMVWLPKWSPDWTRSPN